MRPRMGLIAMAKMLSRLAPRRWWLGGAAMAMLTVVMGMALLGLSGWFIAATAIAGLVPATALVFDVFMPSAGIRLLAMGRTASRYGERLVTHDATLAVLA
ncbi:MAG: ABC transporter ATP-binding protein, partial [Comamonas sp.]